MCMPKIYVVNCLILFLITVKHGVEGARKCEVNCREKMVLELPKKALKIVHVQHRSALVTSVKERIKAYLGYRKVKSEILYTAFGSSPDYSINVFKAPNQNEMKEWIERDMCKIGTTCPPRSDCWGNDAQKCRNLETKYWVKSSQFLYEGEIWTKDLYRTCIMEWACWIKSKEYDVYYETGRGPYIRVGSSNTYLENGADTFEIKDNIAVFVPKEKINVMHLKTECLEYKNELFCQVEIAGETRIINFLKGSTCAVLRSSQICIDGAPATQAIGSQFEERDQAQAATMGDLKAIEETVRSSFVEAMYNDMVMRSYLQNIMEVMNKFIESSSRTNPMLLHDILGLDISSSWVPGGVKICPCLPTNQASCDWTKSLLGVNKNVSHCGNNNLSSVPVSLFGDESIEIMIPDHLTLRTVGQTIMETLAESQLMNEKKFQVKEESITNVIPGLTSALGFLNIKEMIWHYLPLLNLCLIFFIFAKNYIKK